MYRRRAVVESKFYDITVARTLTPITVAVQEQLEKMTETKNTNTITGNLGYFLNPYKNLLIKKEIGSIGAMA